MGRPVLRLATRVSRRTRWTAWAIALACMVLVGSLSLVDGLGAGVDSVTARFSTGPTLYLRGTDLLLSSVDVNALLSISGDYAVLRAHVGTLIVNGTSLSVVVASLTWYHAGNATEAFPADSQQIAVDSGLSHEIEATTGSPPGATVHLTLMDSPPQPLTVAPSPVGRPAMLPDTWGWVRSEFLVALNPLEGGPAQAVITASPLDPALASRLGLAPLQTVGAIGFTRASIAEARSVLFALAAVFAVIIGLLVFSAMGLEVAQRREEIETLRSLGAPPSTVAMIYEAKAAVLALLGATLGSSLGVVVAHAIVSFSPLLGLPNLVALQAPFVPVAFAYALALASAGVAGLVPASRAVRLARVPKGVRGS